MISINDAVKVVKEYTNDVVVKVFDYKEKYYMFLVDKERSYYIVDKNDGRIRLISPLEDFEAFVDATKNKTLKIFPR